MNYLKYIEHSAENLQFFLWYRSYIERFDKLPQSEKVLSAEWTPAQAEQLQASKSLNRKKVNSDVAVAFKGTDFEKKPVKVATKEVDPFSDGSSTPTSDEKHDFDSDYATTCGDFKSDMDNEVYTAKAEAAFAAAGLQWKPCKSASCWL